MLALCCFLHSVFGECDQPLQAQLVCSRLQQMCINYLKNSDSLLSPTVYLGRVASDVAAVGTFKLRCLLEGKKLSLLFNWQLDLGLSSVQVRAVPASVRS